MKTFKCPSCDANLSFSDDREFGFCEFCGTKILLEDYRVTKRIVDEAKIKEAEVREKELALESQKINIKLERERELKTRKKSFLKNYLFSVSILFVLSIIIGLINSQYGSTIRVFAVLVLSVGAFIYIFYFDKLKNEENDRIALESGGIRIPISVDNVSSFDYASLQSIFEKSGFNNVETSNLHDIFIIGKINMVDSVTINGKPLDAKRVYMPNDLVIIKYHGR